MPYARDAVAVAEERAVVEEHLGDRPVGAGVDLLGEHVEVVIVGGRLGVTLGVGRDGDVEVAALLDGGDEVGGALVAVGVRCVRCADASRRVAAEATIWLTPSAAYRSITASTSDRDWPTHVR